MLLGDGSGNFGNAKSTAAPSNSSYFAVAVADLDLNGTPDVAIADIGTPGFLGLDPSPGSTTVYRNSGSATFNLDSKYTDTSDGNQYLAIADFDNKGNPDIVTVGLHNRVTRFTNTTRPSATTLSASTTNASAGTNITFTATTSITGGYADAPSGTVNFYDGSTLIGSGTLGLDSGAYKATFSTTALLPGTHSITAIYAGQYASTPYFGVSKSAAIAVTVSGTNTPPTISDITDKIVSVGATGGPYAFTVGDLETPVGSLTVSAKSSNTAIVPLSAITFGGSGTSRNVSIASSVVGSSTITITVTDGGGMTASDSFLFTVTPPNTPPGISTISNVTVSAGSSIAPISFGIGDNESPATDLVVTATSSNAFIVPNANITLGGTGAVRTIGVTQVGSFPGTSTITVTVTDPGGLSAQTTFVVTVTAGASVTSIDSTSANGTYATGQSINVRVNFSESVTLSGGNLVVTLDSGGSATITPFTGTSAIGVYTIAVGQTSPDLNVTALSLTGGATLVNSGGAAASLTLPASNLASNANLIVNPPPPTTVTFFTVNDGETQRSRLTTITLNFNNPINAANYTALGAIKLTRTRATSLGTVGTIVQTGATGANGRILVSPATGTTTSLTLTFDNASGAQTTTGVEYGSLADGRWQMTIPSLGYTSTLNDPTLRRLFGDFNNDGTVDGTDFSQFGATFGQTVANSPFDFNGDGTVDGIDFAQFGNRFGITL